MFYRSYGSFKSFFSSNIRIFFLSTLFLFLFVSSATAREIILTWDQNSEPDLSHYVVYWGLSSGDYSDNSGDIGLVTEYSVELPDDGQIYYFAVTAVDTSGLESDYSNEVNTGDQTMSPVANAGIDQNVGEGQQVYLDGSDSVDPDGTIVSWQWVQTGGTQVTLDNPSTVAPSFSAPYVNPEGETLTFKLTVTDSQGLESTDTCVVNVAWINEPPVASAGADQNIEEGQQVYLDGSDSVDPDGAIVSWQWVQTGGTQVTLNNPSTATPSFSAPYVNPEGETLTFKLTVTDSQGLESTDTCIVNVVWINEPPVANAGADQNTEEGQQVVLDGSASVDPDGNIISWEWIQTGGSQVTINNDSSMQPEFTSPFVDSEGETLTFKLTVTDSGGLQSTDTCVVNVQWINDPPVANAGADQNVDEGVQVVLNGSGSSDPDGSISAWHWTQTAGTPVDLSNHTTAHPGFTSPFVAPDGETLIFELTVTDAQGLDSTDTCIVNVVWVNDPPAANAGADQNVEEGDQVILDSSNSIDTDGSIVAWKWIQTGGIPVLLNNAETMQPEFSAPSVGPDGASLTFELTVTDAQGLKSTDFCIVNVLWVNDPPAADAGTDQSVTSGESVALDGSGSTDPDGNISSYQWIQTSGTQVVLNDPSSMSPSFLAPSVDTEGDTLGFRLVVTDNGGLLSSSECTVEVSPSTENRILTVKSSWNLISIASGSESTPIEDILEPIMDNIISIWSYDNGAWRVYDPANPGFSDLLEVRPGKGLWVNMRDNAELAISGVVPLDAINLSEGWNLAGFGFANTKYISEAISSIANNVKSVWAYKDGNWKVYDPANPGFSDLTNMEPGSGYWIKVDSPCLWTN